MTAPTVLEPVRVLGFTRHYLVFHGAPVLTLRAPMGTRSHWAHSHWDICAGLDPNRGTP